SLRRRALSDEDADFIGRNLAKAQLALGDAALLAFGQYDWSCVTRHERLKRLYPGNLVPQLSKILHHHAAGVAFKLHPRRSCLSSEDFPSALLQGCQPATRPQPQVCSQPPNSGAAQASDFDSLHRELCSLACEIWLWLEKRRLNRAFP